MLSRLGRRRLLQTAASSRARCRAWAAPGVLVRKLHQATQASGAAGSKDRWDDQKCGWNRNGAVYPVLVATSLLGGYYALTERQEEERQRYVKASTLTHARRGDQCYHCDDHCYNLIYHHPLFKCHESTLVFFPRRGSLL